MTMTTPAYKKTEKWWLGLVILFYALYNLPGFPAYGDSDAALWHGALTLIPLWIISYAGMIRLSRQRRIKDAAVIGAWQKGTDELRTMKEVV